MWDWHTVTKYYTNTHVWGAGVGLSIQNLFEDFCDFFSFGLVWVFDWNHWIRDIQWVKFHNSTTIIPYSECICFSEVTKIKVSLIFRDLWNGLIQNTGKFKYWWTDVVLTVVIVTRHAVWSVIRERVKRHSKLKFYWFLVWLNHHKCLHLTAPQDNEIWASAGVCASPSIWWKHTPENILDHTAYGEPEVTWGSNYCKMNHMSN